jgi:hypothetical protein
MPFTNAQELSSTSKILCIGPAGAGKTLGGLQLEGPIGVFDGEDGARAFKDIFTFGVDPFDSIAELNGKMRSLLSSQESMAAVATVVIDGLTTAWHASLRETEGAHNGRIEMKHQKELKAPWKDFNDLVYRLGKAGKNVWATAQAKADWEIKPGQKPVLRGMKGDIPDKIWFAFDLVIYLDVVEGERVATVLKSRYPKLLPEGAVMGQFSVRRHLAAVFRRPDEAAAPAGAQRGEDNESLSVEQMRQLILDELARLGSRQRGGQVPDDAARRLWALSRRSQDETELRAGVLELRRYATGSAAA